MSFFTAIIQILIQWTELILDYFDRSFMAAYHGYAQNASNVLTPIAKGISILGEKGILVIAVSLILLISKKTRKTGLAILIAVVVGTIITNLFLKNFVQRIRPYDKSLLIRQWWAFVGGVKESDFSFPSGHTTCISAALSALCFVRGKKYVLPSCILVIAMAMSRNYLMVHYPTDVVVGGMVGLLSGAISALIINRIYKKRGNEIADKDKGFAASTGNS